MPDDENDDQKGKSGGDDTAKQKSDKITDDANSGKSADDKSGEGKNGKKSGQVVFDSQEELDKLIQKRLDRATKTAEENAKLSKEQLLEKERDEARNELRISNARDAFIEKTGIPYAKATRLFRMYSSDLEFDDKGKPSNLDELVKTAKKDWPEMFGKVPPGSGDLGGGKGEGENATGSMNTLIRRSARR